MSFLENLICEHYKLELLNQELIDQIASMKFEINKYQIQITNLTMYVENAQFQSEKEQCKEIGLDKQQNQIKQINQLQEMVEKLNLSIEEQNNKIKQFENDQLDFHNKFQVQEQQIEEKEFFIRQLQLELHQLNNQIRKMQKELNQLQEENENKIQENIDLTTQIVNLRIEESLLNQQINPKLQEEIQNQHSELEIQIQELNQQIQEKNCQLEQKCQLIDKFNLKIMNQNAEIWQLKQQFESTFKISEQGSEVEQQDNKKINEIAQLNIKLSKVIDEKEQKILTLKQELQNKLEQMEQIHKNLINQLSEKQSLYYSQSDQFKKSQLNSETENYHYQQLQILKKKYDAILKENQSLVIYSRQIEDYKNKIALLSLEVSRYHNSQKGSNLSEVSKNEDTSLINTTSVSQEKGNNIKTQQDIDKSNKDRDLYCLIVLLFAEIESLRTIDDEKKIEDKSKVQRIIDYYRQKPQ